MSSGSEIDIVFVHFSISPSQWHNSVQTRLFLLQEHLLEHLFTDSEGEGQCEKELALACHLAVFAIQASVSPNILDAILGLDAIC